MLISPHYGFVLLALQKTGSTSLERAFRQFSDVSLQRNPFKHTNYGEFQRFLEPWLAAKGFPRGSYEVVCVAREPIEWLNSWWRYRSRDGLARPSHPKHANYAGHLSFEEFARAHMDGSERSARVERPSEFLRPRDGGLPVDRLFRYERLDLLVGYLSERVGRQVEVGVSNVSPRRSFDLSAECERDLTAFFAPEYEIHGQASG